MESSPVDKVHYSSKKNDWETPPELFNEWDQRYDFTLDVCAIKENTKVSGMYFPPDMDGLKQKWEGERCWMNPPYGREITAWVKKAYEETRDDAAIVVALLPARTDTKWFHQYIYRLARNITFLGGRIKFVGAKHSAPFPSMIVEF